MVVFACTNKETESRIARLEGKVAELESKNGGRAVTPSTSTTTPAQPEVKPDGPLPAFAFKEENHDFGTINEGDIVDHTFTFTNTGEAPLIISNASASCGCTVPQWPKEPIPVGGSGDIKVQFNSRNKPGIQNKTVTITANTFPTATKLRIKANVNKKENPS
ncbi:MAG: DUF1573 domain-containing protein [Cyclobacteriaceae bacterium]|nr:DUF1573 domain-containing protein [Cyclobacteriaceae bacterium HetDA_MAG_MS6]